MCCPLNAKRMVWVCSTGTAPPSWALLSGACASVTAVMSTARWASGPGVKPHDPVSPGERLRALTAKVDHPRLNSTQATERVKKPKLKLCESGRLLALKLKACLQVDMFVGCGGRCSLGHNRGQYDFRGKHLALPGTIRPKQGALAQAFDGLCDLCALGRCSGRSLETDQGLHGRHEFEHQTLAVQHDFQAGFAVYMGMAWSRLCERGPEQTQHGDA